jgi:hypothetical protein
MTTAFWELDGRFHLRVLDTGQSEAVIKSEHGGSMIVAAAGVTL